MQTPPIICLSWCDVDAGESGLVPSREGLRLLFGWLSDDGVTLYGANIAFDLLAAVVTADLLLGPDAGHALLEAIVKAYESCRVRDVLIDQKIIDNAAGCLGLEQVSGGRWIKHRYNLAYTTQRLGGPELAKGEDTWRLRYGELAQTPIASWPPAAREYAELDAYATAWCARVQGTANATRWQRMASDNFPGLDPLNQAPLQAAAAMALKAMSAYGLRTDATQVERYAALVEEQHAQVCESLIGSGLVWVEWLRPEAGDFADKKKWNALKRALRKRGASPEAWVSAMRQVGAGTEYHRATKVAAKMMYEHCVENSIPIVHTAGYSPKPIEKGGKGHAPSACIALDKDATRKAGHELLLAYSEVSHLAKVVSADLKWLRLGSAEPIHSHFDGLKETGRTGSSKPNVQNRARGSSDAAGDRECFVPRDGWVYIDADYEQGELWTLAQVCHWWLGWTTLGDALRAGIDPHTKLGCEIHGCDYSTGLALRKAKDTAFDACRNSAKAVNFGGPGGLGKKTMCEYGAKSYGVVRTEDEWGEIIKLWRGTWAELPDYFRRINAMRSEPWPWQQALAEAERVAATSRGEEYREPSYYSVSLPTGFLRGRTHYTSACNTPYQSVLSTILKVSLWRIWKACYVDKTDALYGSRPVNEIHDQIIVETRAGDLAAAREAAASQQRHMNEAAKAVCPDYPTWTEAGLCERWSKKAGIVRDAAGQLLVWRDKRIQ